MRLVSTLLVPLGALALFALRDELLQDRTLPGGVQLAALQVNQASLAEGGRLLFLPSGSSAPFTADLVLNAAHARISGDSLGRVRVEARQEMAE